VDINTARIIMTLISFAVFAGIIAWALAPANRQAFQEAALIPLDDDDITTPPATPGTKGARHG
jgi:cytochrome c oxidase cbb3-type subunit 4